jgi:hypothetical protein
MFNGKTHYVYGHVSLPEGKWYRDTFLGAPVLHVATNPNWDETDKSGRSVGPPTELGLVSPPISGLQGPPDATKENIVIPKKIQKQTLPDVMIYSFSLCFTFHWNMGESIDSIDVFGFFCI